MLLAPPILLRPSRLRRPTFRVVRFAVSVALVRQRSHSRAGNSLRKVVQTVFPQKWQTNGNNSQARAWVSN
jgi:hypothetical protein